MNPWFIILIIIVFICLFLCVGTSVFNIKKINKAKDITVLVGGGKCTPSLDTLTDVSTYQCCVQGGLTTSSRYVPDLDMVLDTSPIYYVNVCQGYCLNGFANGNCINPTFGEEELFNECLNKLRPVDCIGSAMPVGSLGITYYYAQSVTDADCTVTDVCL